MDFFALIIFIRIHHAIRHTLSHYTRAYGQLGLFRELHQRILASEIGQLGAIRLENIFSDFFGFMVLFQSFYYSYYYFFIIKIYILSAKVSYYPTISQFAENSRKEKISKNLTAILGTDSLDSRIVLRIVWIFPGILISILGTDSMDTRILSRIVRGRFVIDRMDVCKCWYLQTE